MRTDSERKIVRRGIVEAHIRHVREDGTTAAMLCFHFDTAGMEEETLKEAVLLLQEQTDYAPLLVCDDGTLLTFLKQMHLHRCVQVAKMIQSAMQKRIGLTMDYGALTMIDAQDDYDCLNERLERYLQQARQIGGGKICYGTCRYDFCNEGGEEEIFRHFFAEHKEITIHNFYNGMPLDEKVAVLDYRDGVLRIKTSLAKAAFLQNEPFTFIRHPLLPDTIKADVLNAIPNRAEVALGRLRFIDKSPVDRENIRVIPDERIDASIECLDGEEVGGRVHAIAIDSIAISPQDTEVADFCFKEGGKHVTIGFELPDRDNRRVPIKVSGVLRYKKEGQLIFTIYPNHFFKQKIESHIALQQTKLITIMQKMVLNFYQG